MVLQKTQKYVNISLLGVTRLSIMAFSIATLGIMTFSITSLSITTFSIIDIIVTLSTRDIRCNDTQRKD